MTKFATRKQIEALLSDASQPRAVTVGGLDIRVVPPPYKKLVAYMDAIPSDPKAVNHTETSARAIVLCCPDIRTEEEAMTLVRLPGGKALLDVILSLVGGNTGDEEADAALDPTS